MPEIANVASGDIYKNAQQQKNLTLADMLNISKSNYELSKLKELYPSMIAEQQAKSETAQTQAKSTAIKLEKASQANDERKIAQSIFSDPTNYLDKNGNIDVAKITRTANVLMPYTGAEYIKKYTDLATNQSQAASAKVKLSDDQRSSLGTVLAGLSAANETNPEKYKTAVSRWASQFPDDVNAQQLANAYIGNLNYAQPGDQVKQTAAKAAQEYKGPAQQVGINAAGQTVITNTLSGQQQVAGQPQATPNPTSAGVQNFSDYQKDLTKRVESAIQVDTRLNELQDLLTKFKPGAGSKTYQEIGQKLQAIGAPIELVNKVANGDLAASQLFNKFIAQTVTASIGGLSDKSTAALLNDYLKNNPSIETDPKALQGFIDFTKKQNEIPVEEQKFLIDKIKSGTFNPDTHVGETQQKIREKFVTNEQKQSTNIKTGTYKGRAVISRDGGKNWEYK